MERVLSVNVNVNPDRTSLRPGPRAPTTTKGAPLRTSSTSGVLLASAPPSYVECVLLDLGLPQRILKLGGTCTEGPCRAFSKNIPCRAFPRPCQSD